MDKLRITQQYVYNYCEQQVIKKNMHLKNLAIVSEKIDFFIKLTSLFFYDILVNEQ